MTAWLGKVLSRTCALTLFLFAPTTTQAEAEPVTLVVEASLSADAAQGIQRELARQTGVVVQALSAATEQAALPRVIITVVNDRNGLLRVFYWDATGSADSLSVPASPPQVELIAATLASALLQRNLPEFEQREQQRAANAVCESWETFLTMRLALPRQGVRTSQLRTYPITTADF